MARFDTISLLTDFGTTDEFVGVMKAVIRDIAPHTATIDLTHDIAPFDVRAGSLALARAVAYLPSGVVVAIVDPGVGTDRRAIAIEVANGEGVLVGPDNGLLAPAVAMTGGAERAIELTHEAFHLPAAGRTFAGRDIFAPVAAHLCNGVELEALGELIDPGALLPGAVPLPRWHGTELVCEVLWVDRFGNCQLNVGPDDLTEGDRSLGTARVLQLQYGSEHLVRRAHLVSTFAELGSADTGLVPDSTGLLAVVQDQRSAAVELGLGVGDQVVLRALDDRADGDVATTTAVRLGNSPGDANRDQRADA